jgi:ribosome-associated protein
MDEEALIKELRFKAVRSGGAGGQHVNKVATKVVLNFNLRASEALSEIEKERISRKLASRITREHELLLSSDTSRSQLKNKELVTKRFLRLIRAGLETPKKRRKTTPSKKAIEKRLESKKKVAEKKSKRQPPPIDP